MSDSLKVLKDIDKYYTEKLIRYGAIPKGVDWNSKDSQELRFKQLLKVCDTAAYFSINDFGCGFGSLYDYLSKLTINFDYLGLDISAVMIEKAKELYALRPNCKFIHGATSPKIADFSVASGLFNVKLHHPKKIWDKYIFTVLNHMNNRSKRGLSFNCLTKYSDKSYMRDDLYYADPCFFFDYCKKNFSKNVSLLHDYDLYEFTVIVNKERI